MTKQMGTRIIGPVLFAAVAILAVGCGSSSSSSSSSASSSTAPSTTIPSVTQVLSVCQKAATQTATVGSLLDKAQASTPMSQIGDEMKALVAPIQACQTVLQSAIPGLPSGAQSAATAYASSFGPIIQALANPPATSAAVSSWIQQFTSATAAVSQAKAALIQVDPAFADS